MKSEHLPPRCDSASDERDARTLPRSGRLRVARQTLRLPGSPATPRRRISAQREGPLGCRPRARAAWGFVALAGLAALSLTAATPVHAQDKPPAEAPQLTKDEIAKRYAADVATMIAKFDDVAGRTAVATLLSHAKEPEVTDETRKLIAGLLERLGNPDRPALSVAAVDALGEMPGAIAAKPVREILEKTLKAKTPSVDVYGACFRALKKHADPSKATTGLLVGLLQRKENDVIGKAADAISGYKDAPGKLRRELMEEVIKVGESVFQASRDGKDSAAVAKWGAIQSGVLAALRSLSGQNLADPLEFRKWYNDHKKDAKVWG